MKLIITEQQFKQLISEDWFHGTEDSREIDKIGGFGENKTTSIRYVTDLKLYNEFQSLLNKYNTVDEKLYWETFNNPKYKNLWKDVMYKKPIFLSNKHTVANTYAKDKVSFDYQNSTPKTFNIKVDSGKTLTVNAHGERFRGIPVDNFKQALVNSGISQNNVDDVVDRFIVSIRNGRINTDDMGFIGNQIFGFDIIDVVGVLDSYNGGKIPSTVRMVFDPSKVKILKENLREEIEQLNNIIYTAIFFNDKELIDKYKPIYPNIYSHHSTIDFKPNDISNLAIGQTVDVKITGRLITDKVDVLLVDNKYSSNKYPHITLSTNNDVKPYESSQEIINNLDKIKPLNDNIPGKIGYFNGKIITEQTNDNANKNFLGYHASKKNMKDGYYKGPILNVNNYSDVIRNLYMEIISDYDQNLEDDNVEEMNEVFEQEGYGFTYVSDKPISASSYQSDKYKYGNNIYEVYGDGTEILFDDYNEISATIVVSKTPLYFKQIIN